ncbi:MAG: aminotransferase class V-fold PLP-dependent enzyme [Legionellales bacterium]|jgi:threonine aldolase
MNYKYHFFDDYSEGAHPYILDALVRTNLQQEEGYSADSFSMQAEKLIQTQMNRANAQIHFVATGTQANIVCLASLLKPYESVIAVDSGHINVFEVGAIEATGHKVHSLPAQAGKLTPQMVQTLVESTNFDQMVKPKVVYISQTTEVGSIYTKKELEALSKVCKNHDLYFYIDGARLGHALMSEQADFNLQDIANLADMFYIGGTKNGGLIGEAIVIPNISLQPEFRRHLRQRGALLAKARSVSIQFVEFFKNNLYFENAKHANQMAKQLAQGIKACGYTFEAEVVTNQLFVHLPNNIIEKLKPLYGFHIWGKSSLNDHTVIRLVTSWATPETAVQGFIEDLNKFIEGNNV